MIIAITLIIIIIIIINFLATFILRQKSSYETRRANFLIHHDPLI